MRRAFFMPFVIVFVAGLGARAQTSESRPTADEGERWVSHGSIVLRIACDPALLPSGSYLPIKYLLDAGIVHEATAGALKVKDNPYGATIQGFGGLQAPATPDEPRPEDAPSPTAVGWYPAALGGRNVIIVNVGLMFTDNVGPEQWAAIAEAIRQRLQDKLLHLHELEAQRFEELMKRAAQETEALDHRLRELRAIRTDLVSAADFGDLSRESVAGLVREVQKERQEVTLKAEYLRARQAAIQKLMSELAQEAKDPAKLENPILQAYRIKLEAVERKLDEAKMRSQSGLIPQSEVREVEVQLAAAKAELQTKIQEVVNAAGGNRLPMLNDELFKISLELVEATTRREAFNERAARVRELMALADRYEAEVGMKLPAAERAYQAASERLLQLQLRRSDIQPPEVMLLSR